MQVGTTKKKYFLLTAALYICHFFKEKKERKANISTLIHFLCLIRSFLLKLKDHANSNNAYFCAIDP